MDIPEFRFISPDVGVYLYYAGRGREFMALSRADQRVFLDIPGFQSERGIFDDDTKIIRSLNRSSAVRRYLRDPVNAPRPTGLSSYTDSIPTNDGRIDRSFVADLGNVKAMFVEMAVGDLVIMTPFNHYDPLLIGEVVSDWHPDHIMSLPGQGSNNLPYREVRWLAHGLARRDFPTAVAQRMQNRKAITKIDPATYQAIFKLVYHAYTWGNTSKLDVFAHVYNSNDPTSTAEASSLIKYAVSLAIAVELDALTDFYSRSIDDAVEKYFQPEYVIQIAQSFGSPGGYIARLVGSCAAIAVAGTLAVALADESSTQVQAQNHVAQQVEKAADNFDPVYREKLNNLGSSLRAGSSHDIRAKYGRAARAKLGLSLHGTQSPEITAPDRVRE